ncbi:hypothetical protein BDK51DRAFT_28367, partial [Blyttiomyces helicus]
LGIIHDSKADTQTSPNWRMSVVRKGLRHERCRGRLRYKLRLTSGIPNPPSQLVHPTLHGGPLLTLQTTRTSDLVPHTTLLDGSSGLESLQQAVSHLGRSRLVPSPADPATPEALFAAGAATISRWRTLRGTVGAADVFPFCGWRNTRGDGPVPGPAAAAEPPAPPTDAILEGLVAGGGPAAAADTEPQAAPVDPRGPCFRGTHAVEGGEGVASEPCGCARADRDAALIVQRLTAIEEIDPRRLAGLILGSRDALGGLTSFFADEVPHYLFAAIPCGGAQPSMTARAALPYADLDLIKDSMGMTSAMHAAPSLIASDGPERNPYAKFRATFYFIWQDRTCCAHASPDSLSSHAPAPSPCSNHILETITQILAAHRPLTALSTPLPPLYIVLTERTFHPSASFDDLLEGRSGWRHLAPRTRRYGLLGMNGGADGTLPFGLDIAGGPQGVTAFLRAAGGVGVDSNFGGDCVVLSGREV